MDLVARLHSFTTPGRWCPFRWCTGCADVSTVHVLPEWVDAWDGQKALEEEWLDFNFRGKSVDFSCFRSCTLKHSETGWGIESTYSGQAGLEVEQWGWTWATNLGSFATFAHEWARSDWYRPFQPTY